MKIKILFLFLFPLIALAQNTIGLPSVSNFSKLIIKGGLQTWDIKQDDNGIVYFANNEGLITYNGKYWHTYPLPNKTIVRSIELTIDNKIYVGGQDELGYFEPNNTGNLKFISLIDKIQKEFRSFGDVWDIVCNNNTIYFRTDTKIFKYCNDKFEVFTSKSKWLFMGLANNKIFAQEENNGLLVYENNLWNQTNFFQYSVSAITAIISLENNTLLATTLKDGIFTKSPSQSFFVKKNSINWQNEQIYAAQKIDDKSFAVASTHSGLFICDVNGDIIQKISRTEGLQNNNILSLLYDKYGNIWLGLNNGIDMVAYNRAIKIINPFFEEAAGYAALAQNNTLYLGTANYLYSVNLQEKQDLSFCKGTFKPIANAKGQCWGLASINNKILLGHHEGAFVVENDLAKQISTQPGFWNFVATSSIFPTSSIIGGNYNGLSLFSYTNNTFTKSSIIPDFNESSRYITVDDKKNIWVSHPYHGVYRISNYSENNKAFIENYGTKNGLPSNLNNLIFNIKNEIIIATESGLFVYNQQKNKFEIQKNYYNILGNLSIRYLKEDTEGNIWFVNEKKLGVIDYSKPSEPQIIYISELERKILSGFENVYPINKNNIVVSGEKGFYLIDYEKYKKQLQKPTVQIRLAAITGHKDSILFGGFTTLSSTLQPPLQNVPKISHGWSSLHIEFSSTSSFNNSNLTYSYRLKGFENNWSEWSDNTEKEYTNLNSGNYEFEVKVKNNLGVESLVSKYAFVVLPPWYKSNTMKFVYTFLCVGFIYFLYKRQKIKFAKQQKMHEEEQQQLKYIHDLELNKTEAEIISLQNDKLAQEIEFKNSELASSAMHLVQKAEILATVKTSLNQISKTYGNVQASSEIKKLLKSLGDDENIDKEWDSFSKHFDSVHKDFLTTLKEKHPNLTSTELKLSAYLYMNLSTKEIAQLINISVRGVEISRYRLRKKLALPTEVSLVDYMMMIQTKKGN
ncbi:MAG: ligand-binding sensor domain-containing protein [Chitinophagaceae bacterium]